MKESEIILYTTPQGDVKIDIRFEDETFWLSQKKMAELFDVDVRTINEHLKNIYSSGELKENSTIRKFRIVQTEGKREVEREISFYNLDAIIAVGYRVNSQQATQFRIWATKTLKEMKDWAKRLDAFLQFNDYEVLQDAGKVSAKIAKALADEEYEKFRPIQDRNFESDFDREIKKLKNN